MEGPAGREKERVLIQKDVVINGAIKACALDISEGGMYIHTQAEFIEGSSLELDFDIDGTSVHIKAAIQNTQPGIGIGVRFVNATPEIVAQIRRFIQQSPIVQAREEKSSGKNILLVDDSAKSRLMYRSKLNLEGYTVTEASNGVEALKYLHEIKPDLVVLDLWMEGIDGFKVMQLMKLNSKLKDIPIVVLSARSVPADIQRAIDLGARDYMPKMTTTPIKLAEKVKEIFSAMK